ncbi:MAG: hypothetical protein AB1762_16960 [Gemmatimonadota bacterium]
MPNKSVRYLSLITLLVAAVSCSTSDSSLGTDPPEQRPEAQLTVVRSGPSAPQLVSATGSFYAKRGVDREIRLYYRPHAGRADSTEFLRFRVRRDALSRRPDGTPFAQNDSVLITIRVVDPARLLVEFQPSGLQFSNSEPADLKLSYKEAGGDIDGDGDSDATDRALERQLAIWFQESAGQPWTRLTSLVFEDTDEVEGKVAGFTTYLVAY